MLQPNVAFGQHGEALAVHFLTSHGYHILEQNCRLRNDEVDIVALDVRAQELVFVEVKTRRNNRFGWASDAVNGKKIGAMVRVSTAYLREHHWRGPYRFDIVTVVGRSVHHYLNVTWNG